FDVTIEAGGGQRRADGAASDAVDAAASLLRAEGDATHAVGVTFQHGLRLAGGHVPEADGLVPGAGGERLAVGTEGHRPDQPRVPLELTIAPEMALRVQVPELDLARPLGLAVVAGGGGEQTSVGREGDRVDGRRVSLDLVLQLPRGHVAESDRSVMAPE